MSVPTPTLSPNPWTRILDALEKKINRHSYDTWLKPTRYSHATDSILFVRVPTAEFRHVGDKYADLIQEALDNLGLGYEDVQFVTQEDDPAQTPVRHDGGLSAHVPAQAINPQQSRFDWDGAAQLNPRLCDRQRQPVRPRRLPGCRRTSFESL
jgi:chromosomal replication initiator protein